MKDTTRRTFLSTGAAAAASLISCGGKPGRRPNVVLVMTDDPGFLATFTLHGNEHLKTPHTDRVAREGVQFTQFQVCPVCAPTRASLMTGRYNLPDRCRGYVAGTGHDALRRNHIG